MLFVLTIPAAHADSTHMIRIDIISSQEVSEPAGQFVNIQANITNLGTQPIEGVAYISILDVISGQPIDLEDWSAEKGINVSSISPSQSVTHDWTVRLVKAGNYTIDVLFNENGDLSSPAVSSRVSLVVMPKVNLNPNNVLPVAFGAPAALIMIFALVNYLRRNKLGF